MEKPSMENDKNKIKEPFTPENTPNPPQIIDPNKRNDEPAEKTPMKTDKGPSAKEKSERKNQKPASPAKEAKVGESESEISDETAN